MSDEGHGVAILCVDDEPHILQSLKRGLAEEPFQVHLAGSGEEAQVLMARHSNIAVLICDLKMPGISGLELLNWARAQYPDVTRMVLTAYGQTTTVLSALNTGHAFRFLMKPWRLEEDFIPSVHEAIAFHLMHREKAALAEKVARLSLQAQNQQAQIKELTENIRRHRTVIVRLGHWLKEQPEGVSFSWDELKSQAEWLEILAVMEGGGSEPPPS